MKTFNGFLEKIENEKHRDKLKSILDHIENKYTNLNQEIKWNQPMFVDHGTFIIAFSVSKEHIAISPESKTLQVFEQEIKEAGYKATKMLFRIKWNDEIDFGLIDKLIEYNIEDKKEMKKSWR